MHDYEKPCSLDCLEIEEKHDKSEDYLMKFKKQNKGCRGDYDETNLISKKINHL